MTRTTGPRWAREGSHPPEELLQACCDGSDSSADIAAVHSHCETCDACRALWDEYMALGEMLDSHEVPEIASLWPAVRAEIKLRPSPLARWAYAAGAAAAVAVGLVFGLLIVPAQRETSEEWQQSTWAQMGSLLTDEVSFGSLDEAYWAMALPDEEPASSDGGQGR